MGEKIYILCHNLERELKKQLPERKHRLNSHEGDQLSMSAKSLRSRFDSSRRKKGGRKWDEKGESMSHSTDSLNFAV